jgi:hypothetical protein
MKQNKEIVLLFLIVVCTAATKITINLDKEDIVKGVVELIDHSYRMDDDECDCNCQATSMVMYNYTTDDALFGIKHTEGLDKSLRDTSVIDQVWYVKRYLHKYIILKYGGEYKLLNSWKSSSCEDDKNFYVKEFLGWESNKDNKDFLDKFNGIGHKWFKSWNELKNALLSIEDKDIKNGFFEDLYFYQTAKFSKNFLQFAKGYKFFNDLVVAYKDEFNVDVKTISRGWRDHPIDRSPNKEALFKVLNQETYYYDTKLKMKWTNDNDWNVVMWDCEENNCKETQLYKNSKALKMIEGFKNTKIKN